MKILSAYTPKHSLRVLKRLHKNIVRQQINVRNLNKMYHAMLHLERYIDRLDHDKRENLY